VTSVLLEGGATLAGAFRDAGELDEMRLFYAPLVLGGDDARPLIGGTGSERVDGAERALSINWEPSGEDMLARVRMREW
jgi:diaminohydroxyphosphoribosylaminopyrimidine deaminase/5-amino-6-(5-phosphoribosylamino)uracil reductase